MSKQRVADGYKKIRLGDRFQKGDERLRASGGSCCHPGGWFPIPDHEIGDKRGQINAGYGVRRPIKPEEKVIHIDATNPLLSDSESSVMRALAKAWGEWVKLESLHPDETADFRRAIHEAQRIVMARPVQRQSIQKKMRHSLQQQNHEHTNQRQRGRRSH